MAKFTKKQTEKIEIIKAYLQTEIGQEGILVDCDATSVYVLKRAYVNASGLWVAGSCSLYRPAKENVHPSMVNNLYSSCKKDEDFKYWLETL